MNTKLLFGMLLLWTVLACSSTPQQESISVKNYHDLTDVSTVDTLLLVFDGEEGEAGTTCGYINQAGDTIIPTGQYEYCFMDAVTTYAIVMEEGGDAFAIDRQGNRLWDIYWYDNGPDYVEEGLFRIERDGKIGYADTSGKVVIPAQYACASPFAEGRARVTYDCTLEPDEHGEHQQAISDSWFFIDRMGNKVE